MSDQVVFTERQRFEKAFSNSSILKFKDSPQLLHKHHVNLSCTTKPFSLAEVGREASQQQHQ